MLVFFGSTPSNGQIKLWPPPVVSRNHPAPQRQSAIPEVEADASPWAPASGT
jgi:hypothetical protein